MEGCGGNIWSFLFKKGFVSACISYLTFLFFNSLSDLIRDDAYRRNKDIHKDLERLSIAFIIIFGIALGVMAFFFADLVMAGFGFFFNMGFMISSARTKGNHFFNFVRRITGNLVSSCVFMGLFCALIIVIVLLKRQSIME